MAVSFEEWQALKNLAQRRQTAQQDQMLQDRQQEMYNQYGNMTNRQLVNFGQQANSSPAYQDWEAKPYQMSSMFQPAIDRGQALGRWTSNQQPQVSDYQNYFREAPWLEDAQWGRYESTSDGYREVDARPYSQNTFSGITENVPIRQARKKGLR